MGNRIADDDYPDDNDEDDDGDVPSGYDGQEEGLDDPVDSDDDPDDPDDDLDGLNDVFCKESKDCKCCRGAKFNCDCVNKRSKQQCSLCTK